MIVLFYAIYTWLTTNRHDRIIQERGLAISKSISNLTVMQVQLEQLEQLFARDREQMTAKEAKTFDDLLAHMRWITRNREIQLQQAISLFEKHRTEVAIMRGPK